MTDEEQNKATKEAMHEEAASQEQGEPYPGPPPGGTPVQEVSTAACDEETPESDGAIQSDCFDELLSIGKMLHYHRSAGQILPALVVGLDTNDDRPNLQVFHNSMRPPEFIRHVPHGTTPGCWSWVNRMP